MPDLSTTVVEGQAGHPALHNEERTEVNSLRARVASLENAGGANAVIYHNGTTYPTRASRGLTSAASALWIGPVSPFEGTFSGGAYGVTGEIWVRP